MTSREGLRRIAEGSGWTVTSSYIGAPTDYYRRSKNQLISVYFMDNGAVYSAVRRRSNGSIDEHLSYSTKNKFATVSTWLRSTA